MELAKQTDADILLVAEPMMENLMAASTAVDYERHIRDFSERLKACFSPAQFEGICRAYQADKGYFADRSLVAIFRRPHSVALVWRQRFTRAPGEFVAEMVLIEQGGEYRVDHVMVF